MTASTRRRRRAIDRGERVELLVCAVSATTEPASHCARGAEKRGRVPEPQIRATNVRPAASAASSTKLPPARRGRRESICDWRCPWPADFCVALIKYGEPSVYIVSRVTQSSDAAQACGLRAVVAESPPNHRRIIAARDNEFSARKWSQLWDEFISELGGAQICANLKHLKHANHLPVSL